MQFESSEFLESDLDEQETYMVIWKYGHNLELLSNNMKISTSIDLTVKTVTGYEVK